MRAGCRVLVGAVVAGCAFGVSIDRAAAQSGPGVEVGNNIMLITKVAQAAPHRVQFTRAPDINTTIWVGYSEQDAVSGVWTGDGLRIYVAQMERAISECNEEALETAKVRALRYLQTVLVFALHPALEIAQWVRAVRMRCGERVYEANRGNVRKEFAYFQPYINQERLKREAGQQSIAPVQSTTPAPTTAPAPTVPPTTTEDRRTGFLMPNNGGAFQAVSFEASGGGVFAEAPQQPFLFIERQGSGVQEPNQVVPTRRIDGAFGQFKISVDNGPLPRSRLYFNFNYFNMSGSSSGGSFDPGAGFRVNIPGAEGGPSGVSIGGNPLNRVVNILFNNDVESFGGSAGIRIPFNAPGTGTTIEGIVGIGGGRLNSDQKFSGEIPGFARFFAYDSSANVNIAVADLGLGVTQIVRAGPNGVIVFQGEATVSPTYLSASGSDRFSFTGIAPSFTELDQSKTDVGFNVNGSFSFGLPGSSVVGSTISGPSIFIKGGYESRPGLPVYVRDGTNPTRLDLKHADILTVSGGVRVPFGAPGAR